MPRAAKGGRGGGRGRGRGRGRGAASRGRGAARKILPPRTELLEALAGDDDDESMSVSGESSGSAYTPSEVPSVESGDSGPAVLATPPQRRAQAPCPKKTKAAATKKTATASKSKAAAAAKQPNKRVRLGSCPMVGCDGTGNISARYTSHNSLAGCPLAHAKGLVPFKAHKKGYAKLQKEFERNELMKNGAISPDVLKRANVPRSPLRPRGAAGAADARPRFISPEAEDQDKWPTPVPGGLCPSQHYAVDPKAVELFRQSAEGFEAAVAAGHPHNKGKGKASASAAGPAAGSADAGAAADGGSGVLTAKTPPRIEMANFLMESCYSSPFPSDLCHLPCVFVCEYTLRLMKTRDELRQHVADFRRNGHRPCPPGEEVYRNGKLSVWEIDGRRHRVYCQNLCLVSTLFLETKTLFYNVDAFLFYVLTEWTEKGATILGYFSKEKKSSLNYNLSCILVFPHRRRCGYGQFLIDFSYLLSRREGKLGTPEKPLSDLGLLTYRKYWTRCIMQYLDDHDGGPISIADMSQASGVSPPDIISTLQSLGMVKYWRTKHVVVPRADLLKAHRRSEERRTLRLEPRHLRWSPHFAKFTKGK